MLLCGSGGMHVVLCLVQLPAALGTQMGDDLPRVSVLRHKALKISDASRCRYLQLRGAGVPGMQHPSCGWGTAQWLPVESAVAMLLLSQHERFCW